MEQESWLQQRILVWQMSPHMAISQPRENCRAGSLLETLESEEEGVEGWGDEERLKKIKRKNTSKLVALLIWAYVLNSWQYLLQYQHWMNRLFKLQLLCFTFTVSSSSSQFLSLTLTHTQSVYFVHFPDEDISDLFSYARFSFKWSSHSRWMKPCISLYCRPRFLTDADEIQKM